jgi:hypothetical protein
MFIGEGSDSSGGFTLQNHIAADDKTLFLFGKPQKINILGGSVGDHPLQGLLFFYGGD